MAITVDVGKIKLVWRGTYAGGTAYEVDDLVEYDDGSTISAYINVANSTGQVPSTAGSVNSTYWNLMAQGASATSAGTRNGEIQYKVATGFGASTLFYYDSVNKALGIGTTNPTTSLSITGVTSTTSLWADNIEFQNLNVAGISTFAQTTISDTFYSREIIEAASVDTSGKANSTTNIDIKTATTWVFGTNADGTWTHNLRGDGSTTLNDLMATNDCLTYTCIAASNNASYYTAALNIDGSGKTVEWLGGSAPTASAGAGYDVYTFNVIKTASDTYTILGSSVQYN